MPVTLPGNGIERGAQMADQQVSDKQAAEDEKDAPPTV